LVVRVRTKWKPKLSPKTNPFTRNQGQKANPFARFLEKWAGDKVV